MNQFPTNSELTVMRILQDSPKGLYGLQIVERSEGAIKRGSIYVLTGRLIQKGFLSMEVPKAEPNYSGLPRPIYKLSGEGARVLKTAGVLGMQFVGASA